jgi:L-fuculose-phosphate aldolase
MTKPDDIIAEIISAGERLYRQGVMPGGAGNISARLGNEIFITPAGVCKGKLCEEAIVRVDMSGKVIYGGIPTTELPMHLRVYALRPDIRAVVHVHGANAVALTVAGKAFRADLLPEVGLKFGRVVVTDFATPSSIESAEVITPHIANGIDAVIIPRHGIVALADNLEKAVMVAEAVEYSAKVQLKASYAGANL